MRFRIQWAIWCCRIPLKCTILTNLLQAFRKDSISLRSITSFLHTSHIKFLMEFHRIFFGTTCISFPNILSSGVFRRETASGFHPWGNVVSPPKRVAEGLCGWRHGNSFPMTQSAQSHRQMRSIPHCSKAVFYVFVFDRIHDSATMDNLFPKIFQWADKTIVLTSSTS